MMTIMNMLSMARNYVKGFIKKEEGQGMVEYALIIALIAVVVIVALIAVGDQVAVVFNNIVTKLGGASQ